MSDRDVLAFQIANSAKVIEFIEKKAEQERTTFEVFVLEDQKTNLQVKLEKYEKTFNTET